MCKQKIFKIGYGDTDTNTVNKLLEQDWVVKIFKIAEVDTGNAWVVLEHNPDNNKQKILKLGFGETSTDTVNKLLEQGWGVKILKAAKDDVGNAWVVLEYDPGDTDN